VRLEDQEKLAFAAPDLRKYCSKVMPLGPMNAPATYTAMKQVIKQEADALFALRFPEFGAVGCKQIIDDSILWSIKAMMVIHYFRCFCEVHVKFRISFKGKKCSFFMDRFEWIGIDVCTAGNRPAQSKFELVRDWITPSNATALSSFLGLVGFYSRFIPNFEQVCQPLRQLLRKYYRKPFPADAWTATHESCFATLKTAILRDPCLARFDEQLPVFLKTDWSKSGMSYILMQPASDEDSLKALQILEAGGENLFDSLMHGARLRPVRFGSRQCSDREQHFHSFVGEAVTGQWAIGHNRRYLWGAHFYWMCDCNSLRELFEYSGNIHVICRIAQELLGYHFTIIHRPSRMMKDVDALSRYYDPLIQEYESMVFRARQADEAQRPAIYVPSSFPEYAIRCPDHIPQASSTTCDSYHSHSQSTLCAGTATPTTIWNSVTLFPVCVCPPNKPIFPYPMETFPMAKAAPWVNASSNVVSSVLPVGWLSVGSRRGGLGLAFASLNHDLAAMPILLVRRA
jgi:hypothetical protein